LIFSQEEKMNAIDTQILNLIRASYPVIVVESHEEARVCEVVNSIAAAMDVVATHKSKADTTRTQIFHWTVSRGMEQAVPAPKNQQKGTPQHAAPAAALKFVSEFGKPTNDHPAGPRAIFVLKDFHPYISNPQVLRALRDVAGELIHRHQTIILVSPTFQVPLEAEKEIAVVTYPLPTAEELAEQLDRFIDALPESIPVNVNGDRAVIARALQGLTRFEADAVLAQAVISTGVVDLSAVDFILVEKANIVKKSGLLEFWPEQASYSDVGGLDLLKSWTQQAMTAFSPEAVEYGIEPPRGFLAVGVPGSGKSLLAKAVAGGTMPLVRLDIGALMGGIVGQSEANMRAALRTIEAIAPCVVWADELEKALGGVGGGERDGGTSMRVLGTLLTWLQETTAPVFVVATANDISSLRPELIRRFDEVFFTDIPQEQEREDIFCIHLGKRGRVPADYDLTALAKATDGYTGAEIEKIVKTALRMAFTDGGREITDDDLMTAVKATVPLSTTMTEEIEKMREWASRARPASSKQETGHKVEADGRAMMFA
jgi:AAA+ superfamily predicted ATPase